MTLSPDRRSTASKKRFRVGFSGSYADRDPDSTLLIGIPGKAIYSDRLVSIAGHNMSRGGDMELRSSGAPTITRIIGNKFTVFNPENGH